MLFILRLLFCKNAFNLLKVQKMFPSVGKIHFSRNHKSKPCKFEGEKIKSPKLHKKFHEAHLLLTQCTNCGRVVQHKGHYHKHIAICEVLRKTTGVEWKICKKQFFLDIHQKGTVKLQILNVCQKNFLWNLDLLNHQRTHTKI